jgi:hypothetical protein
VRGSVGVCMVMDTRDGYNKSKVNWIRGGEASTTGKVKLNLASSIFVEGCLLTYKYSCCFLIVISG